MYWLRLQVFTAKLYKKDVNGQFAPVQDFLPMNLRWSNATDFNGEFGYKKGWYTPAAREQNGVPADSIGVSNAHNVQR